VRSSAANRKTILDENIDIGSFITNDQKRKLESSVKSGVKDFILQRNSESNNNRFLEEGDWDFINDILADLDFDFELDTETDIAGIEFTFGTLSCNSISINDIITEGSGSATEYNLSFRVTGINLNCMFDYEYDGGFLIGSGSGDVETYLSQGSFVQTELIFTSPNFDDSGPTGASIACNADIGFGDIYFDDFWLDLLVGPLLPIFLEPVIEPLICEVIVALDELLSDAVMALNEILEEFNGPLPPELIDNLYPEQQLNETLISSTVPFVNLAPIIENITDPLDELVSNLTDDILELNGTLAIPLMLPITENITLNEIRVFGLDIFDIDILSLIGQYTLSTQFEQEYLGIEIELNVTNEDGTTDIVLLTSGINDLNLNFAFLLVLEDVSDEIPWLEDPTLALESLDCILDTIYAFEIAGLSLSSGSLDGLEISGLSELEGPQELINEVSDAVFFMYDAVLNNALTYFFESDVRSLINGLITPALPTCLEKLSGETVYVPNRKGCLKIELFDGGVLAIDASDNECANEVYTSTQIYCQFDYKDEDKVFFKEGDFTFTGWIQFTEDSSFSEVDLVIDRVNVAKKTFKLLLTLPTCTTSCYA